MSKTNRLWISWRDEAFGEVSISNCLSYFARSPFVELQNPSVSNNKLVSSRADAGIEYVVQDAQPPHLFVIRMQATTKAAGVPLALFYVLDSTIYACPSLHHVLDSRRRRCGYKVSQSLDLLRDDLNPIHGALSSRPVNIQETIARLEAARIKQDSEKLDDKGDSIIAQML